MTAAAPGAVGLRRALLVLAAAALLLVGAGAGKAQAHAAFESSTPAAGAVLELAPAQVLLHFGAAAETAPRSLRVLDAHGSEVQRGPAVHPGGRASDLAVQLAPVVPAGSYLVLWRVVSADSHPVDGSFTFSVGHRGAVASAARIGTDPTVAGLIATARGIGFLGIAVFLGGVWFVQLCCPAGVTVPGGRRLTVVGWYAAVLGAAGSLALQGPYSAGVGPGSIWTLLPSSTQSRYGHAVLVRLALLVVTAAIGRRALRSHSTASAVLFDSSAAAMLATFAWTGHAGVGTLVPLAVLSDVAHLSAMSVWLGGLLQLVVVLPQVDGQLAGRLAARFSRAAAVSAGVLVISGSVQSWRQAGVLDSLGSTYYGRLLLAKTGLVLATLLVASGSRRWVVRQRERTVVSAHVDVSPVVAQRCRQTGSGVADVAALRRSVLAEAVLLIAVLGVTSFLVSAPPAREAYAARHTTVVRDLVAGPVRLRLTSAPTAAMALRLEVDPTGGDGRPVHLAELGLTLSRPGVGSVAVPMTDVGGDRFVAADVMVPGRGSWTVTVRARTSPIDEWTATAGIRLTG